MSHHDHMFTGQRGLKKIVFLVCILAPWRHFRELQACCCACSVPVYPAHKEQEKNNADSGNALNLTCQKETATFQQLRTCMSICYSPGLVFCSLRMAAVIPWLFASQRLWPCLCVHCACDRHMTRRHDGVLKYMEHLSLLPHYRFLLVFLLFISRR